MNTPAVHFGLDMDCQGYAVVPGYIEEELLDRLRMDLEYWINRSDETRRRNGLGESMRGTAHHILGREDSIFELFCRLPLDEELRNHFDGPYILNSFSGLMHMEGLATDYMHVQKFHRDVRTYAGDFRLMVNMLVMLDDFTIENGATRILSGSHRIPGRPPEDYLQLKSSFITGKAGTIVLFNSNLWHSASFNQNGEPRRALTMNYTRPLMKQQIDFPRLVGDIVSDDPRVREVLGFRSRVPADHNQWYQSNENRFYYSDQG